MTRLCMFITAALLQTAPALAADGYVATSVMAGSMRVIGSLVLIIGLVLLCYALAKKRFTLFPGQRQGVIRIIEMRSLAPKKAVALIEVRGKELLIGIGQDNVSLLYQLNQSANFEETLKQQLEENR